MVVLEERMYSLIISSCGTGRVELGHSGSVLCVAIGVYQSLVILLRECNFVSYEY